MKRTRAIKALYLANAREFLRERMALFLVLLLPVALAVFFGLVFGGIDGGSQPLQLGLVNEDDGPSGELLTANLAAPEMEDMLAPHTGTRDELLASLGEGNVDVVVVLPRDLSRSIAAGETVSVETLYDPERASSGGGLGTVRTLLSDANLALSGSPRLIEMVPNSIQSDALRPIDLFVPNMLGVAMLWLGLFGTALPVVQQREGQVLRRLGVTPLAPVDLLVAHVGWRLTVGLLQAALFLLVGYLGFGVAVGGSWPLLAAAVVLGTLVFVVLGYVLANLAPTSDGVMAAVQLANFPLMFLSGSLFPVETLPGFLRPLVDVLPLTYLVDALRQIVAGAPPLHPLGLDFAVLGGWLVVLTVLAARLWRWE